MPRPLAPGEARLTDEQRELVEGHMKLLRFFARKYSRDGDSRERYVQAGAIGLGRAVQLYDPARDVKFSQFAKHHIRAAVQAERANEDRTVRIPPHVLRDPEALAAAPTSTAASDLGPDGFDALDHRPAHRPGDLDDDVPPPPYGGSLDDEDRGRLAAAIARLPEKERGAIEGRLAGRKLREIAADLGVTKQWALSLVNRAVAKLHAELADAA